MFHTFVTTKPQCKAIQKGTYYIKKIHMTPNIDTCNRVLKFPCFVAISGSLMLIVIGVSLRTINTSLISLPKLALCRLK